MLEWGQERDRQTKQEREEAMRRKRQERRGKKTKMVGELCLASTVKGAQAA